MWKIGSLMSRSHTSCSIYDKNGGKMKVEVDWVKLKGLLLFIYFS